MGGALMLSRLIAGTPLNEGGPDWEIWAMVLGAGLGGWAARHAHDQILKKFFGYNSKDVEDHWQGR